MIWMYIKSVKMTVSMLLMIIVHVRVSTVKSSTAYILHGPRLPRSAVNTTEATREKPRLRTGIHKSSLNRLRCVGTSLGGAAPGLTWGEPPGEKPWLETGDVGDWLAEDPILLRYWDEAWHWHRRQLFRTTAPTHSTPNLCTLYQMYHRRGHWANPCDTQQWRVKSLF